MKRVLSGVQPSGTLQLGNYLGALRNWVGLQHQYECLFCVVDLHAITVFIPPEELRQQTYEIAATYMACGIDPEKSQIFVQSHVPAHAQLGWVLGCKTPMGWLNRMTQFKDKAGKHRETASLGLYAYPALQAADILLYHAAFVPVGEDQKQHIELTRDIAISVNSAYEKPLFTIPEPMILEAGARIMSLRDGTKKMSKSDPSDFSRIHLRDDAGTIAQKIRKAKTDPEPLPGGVEGLEGRPEAKNLLTIYAVLTARSLPSICEEFEGRSFSDFKAQLTDVVVAAVEPIGREITRLLAHTDELDRVFAKGAAAANEIAEKTLAEVYETFGLLKRG